MGGSADVQKGPALGAQVLTVPSNLATLEDEQLGSSFVATFGSRNKRRLVMKDLVGTKGGSGVWQRIVSEMPEHDVFIEAYWGRGTLSRKKRPAEITVGIDLDPDAICDGTGSGAMMFQCDSLAWLRGYFGLLEVSPNSETSADAATLGGFASRRHLVYMDPPYDGFEHYYDFRSKHKDVIDTFFLLPCPAMLSGYKSEYYAGRLDGCRSIQIETTNRAGKRCTEWVWFNFAEPERYHDTRFVGDGRRDRERIRKRAAKWKGGLERMPIAERQAILEACASTLPDAAVPAEVAPTMNTWKTHPPPYRDPDGWL